MLWFTVWTVLVLATLVGAFFLGRHLYRSGRALAAAVARASDVMAELAERTSELTEAAQDAVHLAPVELADPAAARARLAETAVATERRRAAKGARREATFRRWRSFSH
ncbi:MAG: hypothetical protein HGA44_00995 [Cellulomonadaceae bacterium]|nr:hypothetical protein [Cellulomonadaceae bacterium]